MSARDLTLEPLPVFRSYRFLHSSKQILLGALADVQIAHPRKSAHSAAAVAVLLSGAPLWLRPSALGGYIASPRYRRPRRYWPPALRRAISTFWRLLGG